MGLLNFGEEDNIRGSEEESMESKEESKDVGLHYKKSPKLSVSRDYPLSRFLTELEPALKERFESIEVEPRDSSSVPDNPVYTFDENNKRYPTELVYDLGEMELTVSRKDARMDSKVKIEIESESIEETKALVQTVDDLYEKYISDLDPERLCLLCRTKMGMTDADEEGSKEHSQKRITKYSWDDIGGLEEQKKEIKKYVEWPLEKPETFEKLDIEPPRGILLYGPPGTGKTLIAKTIASETEAEFYSASASDLTSKWYGNTSTKVDNLFSEAKENSPSIVFLDEVDSLFRDRGNSHEATHRMVTTFLKNLDGIDEIEDAVFIGATNRIEDLDEAVLRKGRLGRQIEIPAPDEEEREEILRIHTRGSPIKGLDYEELSKEAKGLTGADLEELINQAGFYALGKNSDNHDITEIDTEDLVLEEEDFYRALEDLQD